MAQGSEIPGEEGGLAACQHRQHPGGGLPKVRGLTCHHQERRHVGGDGGVVGRAAAPFQDGGGDGAVLLGLTALDGADRLSNIYIHEICTDNKH